MASDSLISGRRKKFSPEGTEHLLGGREDVLIVFAPPGHVKQTKQDSLRADSQGS